MSDLRQAATDYLLLRGALGHKLADAARLLPRFVAYLDEIGAETVTVEAALAWTQQPDATPGSTVWPRRMSVARGFARHLAGSDARTEVPPAGLIPSHQRRRPPFIYAPSDITALMSQARSIRSPFRAATMETLIGLLAVTGMFSRGRRLGALLSSRISAGGSPCGGPVTIATGVVHVGRLAFMSPAVGR